jgi:hypothetical protein
MSVARDLRIKFHSRWFILADIKPLIDFVFSKGFSVFLKFTSFNLEITPYIESARRSTFTIKG